MTTIPTVTNTPRRIDYVRLDEVRYAPRNPKRHDAEGIGRSVGHHGFVEVPVVDDRTGRLVAGHGRHEQLTAMHTAGQTPPDGVTVDTDGMWRMPVVAGWASRSDIDAETYLVGSNQLSALGGWDTPALAEMLAEFDAADLLDLTGFDESDLDDFKRLLTPPDLDDLADRVGDVRDEDGHVVVRVSVDPEARDRFNRLMKMTGEPEEADAFSAVVAWASSAARQDGVDVEP